jgi:hypothetical protein
VDERHRDGETGVDVRLLRGDPTGTGDDESVFYQSGVEVLTGLQSTLADEPVSLMLTDPDGLVLTRLSGDRGLLRALDDVHLAPGFAYAERDVGTSALGLALADQAPVVVAAEEHYSVSLQGYTCAAAPVLDSATGRLVGSVNITTWSRSSSGLLLALAQSAATGTAALLLARSRGLTPRSRPQGEVTRVETARREPGAGTLTALSTGWTQPLERAVAELRAGRVVVAVGEPGSGRATLLAQALRQVSRRTRILSARTPAPRDVEPWLELWTPELGKPDTSVVLGDVDRLPSWGAQEVRDRLLAVLRRPSGSPLELVPPVVLTAEVSAGVPAALGPLVDTVVPVPPLRERPDDVLPLAEHLGRRARGREVAITPRAGRVLRDHAWPGGVAQLARVVSTASARSGTIDLQDLPPEVLSRSRRPLSRLESVEREEIVRALTRPGATVKSAAQSLGMGRATIYRKMQYYGIRLPGRGGG